MTRFIPRRIVVLIRSLELAETHRSRPSTTGIPELTSVANVSHIPAISERRIKSPNNGTLNIAVSIRSRPDLLGI